MTNLNIDLLLGKIQDARTREYMDEVLSCYYSKNYRSAIVMLYSIVICDLIYKLQRMVEIYDDKTSKDILEEIERLQYENPNSPVWENTLREKLLQNKRVITSIEATHIDALQKERHLCAHPVIKNNAELHKPNQACAYAHIVTSLEDILTRPALLDNKLLNVILEDIASNRRILRKADEFLTYVRQRFLNKIKSTDTELKLIMGLWKIVFKLTNDDAKKNRKINLLLLNELCDRNVEHLRDLFQKNSEKLSSNICVNDLDTVESFVVFMNNHPTYYDLLTQPFKITIEAQIRKYALISHISFFLHNDVKKFFEQLLECVAEDDNWRYMIKYIKKRLSKEESLKIPISIFSRSESFYEAESNYNTFIKPFLNEFSLENLIMILNSIKENSQIRWSYKVQDKYPCIKSAIQKLKPDFDFSEYSFIK